MTPHVIFGTHPLFGDYADLVHARGGIVARIVRNVAEPPRRPGQGFEERLARYHAWLEGQGIPHRVEVVALADFTPRAGETSLFGFRGPKLLPLREQLRERFGLAFPPLVHPAAYVAPMAVLGEGIFVGAGAVVAPGATVGAFTLVNRGATVGHDCAIGPCAVIGPAAALASGVRVGRGAVIGIGARVIPGLTLGEECSVAAGAVVIRDVPPRVMVAGVPAVVKKPVSGG